ncbi:MAG: pitrilysin family protein [Propionicimonas sp.]|nr:pitrilysin family protein [Propionicimonas sp.]
MPLQYPVHTTTLDNGLRVVVSPDPAVPIVAVNLWYDVGSRDEQPGQTGWAHLFEHLMFQGSANVASGEHLNTLQNVGGSVNATTSFDRTNYFETVPTGALDLALWLEADRLASLADNLSQANVDTQREVVKEEKRQRYDNVPYGHAVRHLVELVFPSEHPYGHVTIGRMADLDAATPETAQAFFGRHYQPENAVLSLVGDLTVREGFRRAEKAFGWIAGGERRPRTNTAPLPGLRGRPRQEILADVPADAVYLAWRLPARDSRRFDATDLALAVLGDGQSSRLQRVLVRERELAASASAGALGLIAGTSLGLASARALPGVSPDDLEGALTLEVERLASAGPTPSEVARAVVQFERLWLSELAQVDARADQFGGYATLHGDPERVNRRLAEVQAISVEEVGAAAAELLTPDRSAVLRYVKETA